MCVSTTGSDRVAIYQTSGPGRVKKITFDPVPTLESKTDGKRVKLHIDYKVRTSEFNV